MKTPLEQAYENGTGCGGLDAAGVKALVEMSRESEALPPGATADGWTRRDDLRSDYARRTGAIVSTRPA